MRLILDGYNLMFGRIGSKFKVSNMRSEREKLLGLLVRFKGHTGDDMTVVFDGSRGDVVSHQQDYHGLKVLFSLPGKTADQLIRELVSHDAKAHTLRIVTSDNSIAAFVKRFGASVEGCREFLGRLDQTVRTADDESPDEEPIEKLDGLTDAEVEYWLKYFEEKEEQ